jgi:hypothetical protein
MATVAGGQKGADRPRALTLTSDGKGKLVVREEDRTMPQYRARKTKRRELSFKFEKPRSCDTAQCAISNIARAENR